MQSAEWTKKNLSQAKRKTQNCNAFLYKACCCHIPKRKNAKCCTLSKDQGNISNSCFQFQIEPAKQLLLCELKTLSIVCLICKKCKQNWKELDTKIWKNFSFQNLALIKMGINQEQSSYTVSYITMAIPLASCTTTIFIIVSDFIYNIYSILPV